MPDLRIYNRYQDSRELRYKYQVSEYPFPVLKHRNTTRSTILVDHIGSGILTSLSPNCLSANGLLGPLPPAFASPPLNWVKAVVRGVIGFLAPNGVLGVLGRFKKICLFFSHLSSFVRLASPSMVYRAFLSSMSSLCSASRSSFSALEMIEDQIARPK